MTISAPTLAFGLVGLTALTLFSIGSPTARGKSQLAEAATVAAAGQAPPAPVVVNGQGVTLTSVSVTLPTGDRVYPDGPHADAINNNCLACHSAGMVLTQPALTRADWKGEVNKMINTYKAPVQPDDAAAIVDYLAAMKPGG